MKRALFALLILTIPRACPGTTAPDLSPRIRIDGRAVEYTPDEWILDAATAFRETDGDSRWGANNDISRIAATWDENFLYIAIEGSFDSSALMAFLEHDAGGISDLVSIDEIRRNIIFSGIYPNIIMQASRSSLDATVAAVSILEPLLYLDPSEYDSEFFQPAGGPGALEIALPWSRVLPLAGYVKLLAAVTGGTGTGTGDAAPDPAQSLSGDRQAQAWLDNAITIPVDSNHDGEPDMGVSPRSAASFEFNQAEPATGYTDVGLSLEAASFAPDLSQVLRFQVGAPSCREPVEIYVSCEVFSVTGRRVRVLYQDEPRVFEPGTDPQWDEWDGRDDSGEIVRGGVYVLLASGAASPGDVSSTAKQSVAVIR
jgi:hypothetical protein